MIYLENMRRNYEDKSNKCSISLQERIVSEIRADTLFRFQRDILDEKHLFTFHKTVREEMNGIGFYFTETGGGCTAFVCKRYGGAEVLVTQQLENQAPESWNDPVDVTVVDNNGNEVFSTKLGSMFDCFKSFKKFVTFPTPA
jgi:hypothetical protein